MLDRTAAPVFHVPGKFEIKQAENLILKGGIPVHIINAGNQPICRLEIIFKGGKWYEPTNGISWFTNKMLLEGTANYTSEQINKTFEQYGAFYEITPGQDLSILTFHTLNKNLEQLLPVLKEILTIPNFPDKELEILKNVQIQTLNVNLEKNSFVASRQFREYLFSKDHPYGRNIEIKDIQQISKETLINFYKDPLQNNFEVLVCGDINPKVRSVITNFFEGFRYHEKPKGTNTFDIRQTSPGNYKKEKKDSLQSSLRIGKKIISKSHPDYIKLLITNELFGGYFGSRLMQKLREEKGYTYGIYSQLAHYHHESYFVIATDVIKKYKKEAIDDIKNEWLDIYKNGVNSNELEKVKNYFKGSFLSSISNPFAFAEKFKNIHFHNLGYTFYDTLFSKIDTITSEDIQFIMREHLNLDEMLFVEVG